MINTKVVEPYCLMIHAKFQNHRPTGSGEEDSYMFLLFIAMVVILVMQPRPFIQVLFPLPKDAPYEV